MPAERENRDTVIRQYSLFACNEPLTCTLDGVSTGVLILNSRRQIVFANRSFLDMIRLREIRDVLGLRTGEAIGCIRSDMNEDGCGTTEYCRECGAARAILSSLNGHDTLKDCSILLNDDPNALNIRVKTVRVEMMGEAFTVFSISDIGDEKRREVLERIFLHDVRNTAGGIKGFSCLAADELCEDPVRHMNMITDLSEKLLDEIDSYHQLIRAENRDLKIAPVRFETGTLLEKVRSLYSHHEVAENRELRISPGTENLTMFTDEIILLRVIGNMTKNALEAIAPGQSVTLSCAREGEKVRFEVHNPGIIPPDAGLLIFQRSFSTKGPGRGLGTYSIKLLSEHYLRGTVGFTTSATGGTTFFGIYPGEISES